MIYMRLSNFEVGESLRLGTVVENLSIDDDAGRFTVDAEGRFVPNHDIGMFTCFERTDLIFNAERPSGIECYPSQSLGF